MQKGRGASKGWTATTMNWGLREGGPRTLITYTGQQLAIRNPRKPERRAKTHTEPSHGKDSLVSYNLATSVGDRTQGGTDGPMDGPSDGPFGGQIAVEDFFLYT